MYDASDHHNREHHYRELHTIRVMVGLATSLLLLVATVNLWPLPSDDDTPDRIYTTRGPETILIEEIVQTNQRRRMPPPPAPLPPVIVPNDELIEEPLEFTDSYLPIEEPSIDQDFTPGLPEGQNASMARVTTDPKPVRIVEPEYTRAAKKKRIRAEVVVEVLIDKKGRVEATKVLERFLLGNKKDDPKQAVSQLGYGLEEAALSAAGRWLFRPARKNGTAVRSYHALTFRFGV